jgi:hypothetical protein
MRARAGLDLSVQSGQVRLLERDNRVTPCSATSQWRDPSHGCRLSSGDHALVHRSWPSYATPGRNELQSRGIGHRVAQRRTDGLPRPLQPGGLIVASRL